MPSIYSVLIRVPTPELFCLRIHLYKPGLNAGAERFLGTGQGLLTPDLILPVAAEADWDDMIRESGLLSR